MHLLILFLAAFSISAAELGQPLPRAHAHNDYEHPRPLFDALAQGFGSVEADIHLKGNELLVAHDPQDAQPGRTLQKLYLDPLRSLAQKNGNRIYPGGPTVILLIDIKTEADSTYALLKKVLTDYENILTRFSTTGIQTNAVTIILSGNRPRQTLLAETDRLVAFDGRLSDLGLKLPVSFMPLVSDNWQSHFQWKGQGSPSPEELSKLKNLVAKVHAEGRILRFWATPNTREAWKTLDEAGVDLLNTDDLAGLATFLHRSHAIKN